MNSQMPKEYQEDLQRYAPDTSFIPPQVQQAMQSLPPEKAYKSAANNFYTIAGLSFVNSLISTFGGGFIFVIGLGITQLVDAIARYIGGDAGGSRVLFTSAALVFDLGTCIAIALFGYFTSKQENWALPVGIALYALDALLVLWFKDWIGFAFHLFFLWQLWMIYRVLGYWRKLGKLPADSHPQNIGVS